MLFYLVRLGEKTPEGAAVVAFKESLDMGKIIEYYPNLHIFIARLSGMTRRAVSRETPKRLKSHVPHLACRPIPIAIHSVESCR